MFELSTIHKNPFVLTAIICGTLLVLKTRYANRPGPYRLTLQKIGPRTTTAATILLIISGILSIVYELYFTMYSCAVSPRYINENILLAVSIINILNRTGVIYWLDFATLLSALRGQTVNVWDHDTDVSIIHPDYLNEYNDYKYLSPQYPIVLNHVYKQGLSVTPKTQILVNMLKSYGYPLVTYDSTREVLQVWASKTKTSGPHIDLWLWTPEKQSDGSIVFYCGDRHLYFNPRPDIDIFPLYNTSWLGIQAALPRDAHGISQKEYGGYGTGAYMTAQVFRRDCFHNFFNWRFLY